MAASTPRKMSTHVSFDNLFVENKTPKTLLNEYCAKKKISLPTYNSKSSTTPSGAPLFQCTCLVDAPSSDKRNVKGEGVGANKKEAEQKAALSVLPELIGFEELFGLTFPGQILNNVRQEVNDHRNACEAIAAEQRNLDNDPVSDTDDEHVSRETNAQGQLTTLCQRNKLSIAEWKETEKRGANGKLVYSVTCSVGSLATATGRRLSKKDAKKIAAFRVLRMLQNQGYEMDKKKSAKSSDPKESVSEKEEVSSTACSHEDEEEQTENSGSGRPPNILLLPTCTGEDIHNDEAENEESDVAPANNDVDSDGTSLKDAGDEGDMEIDILSQPIGSKLLKRKLQFIYSSPEPEEFGGKRMFEPLNFRQLTCPLRCENCLKFVKDFAHSFLHLPIVPSIENLVSEDTIKRGADKSGGSLSLLKQLAIELDLKFSFTKLIRLRPATENSELSSTSNYSVFLKIEMPSEYKHRFQRIHSIFGFGNSPDEARENASLSALLYIKEMRFNVTDSEF